MTSYKRASSDAKVVFPVPLAPTKAIVSPAAMLSEISFSTSTSGSAPCITPESSSDAIEKLAAGGYLNET